MRKDLPNQEYLWPEVRPTPVERKGARKPKSPKEPGPKARARERDNGNPNLWDLAIDDLKSSGRIDNISDLNDILFLFRTRDGAYQHAAGAPFQDRKGRDFLELLAHAVADAVAAYAGLFHSAGCADTYFRLIDIYEPLIEVLVRLTRERRRVLLETPPKRRRRKGESNGDG